MTASARPLIGLPNLATGSITRNRNWPTERRLLRAKPITTNKNSSPRMLAWALARRVTGASAQDGHASRLRLSWIHPTAELPTFCPKQERGEFPKAQATTIHSPHRGRISVTTFVASHAASQDLFSQ